MATDSGLAQRPRLERPGARIAFVVSTFHHELTSAMMESAQRELATSGVAREDMPVALVPGAFELPLVARRFARRDDIDAVICLGLVLKGETTHDLYWVIEGSDADNVEDGKIVFLNRTFAHQRRDALMGRSMGSLRASFTPESWQRFHDACAQVLRTGQPVQHLADVVDPLAVLRYDRAQKLLVRRHATLNGALEIREVLLGHRHRLSIVCHRDPVPIRRPGLRPNHVGRLERSIVREGDLPGIVGRRLIQNLHHMMDPDITPAILTERHPSFLQLITKLRIVLRVRKPGDGTRRHE